MEIFLMDDSALVQLVGKSSSSKSSVSESIPKFRRLLLILFKPTQPTICSDWFDEKDDY